VADASKLVSYAVLQGVSENAAKLVSYAVIAATSENASKLVSYAVLSAPVAAGPTAQARAIVMA
jgi:hypothetical protein